MTNPSSDKVINFMADLEALVEFDKVAKEMLKESISLQKKPREVFAASNSRQPNSCCHSICETFFSTSR